MIDERTEKQQKSVDRARVQSHLILRRSLAELRNLQKVRTIQEQIADKFPTPKPAPTSDAAPAGMDALVNLSESQLAQRFRESGMSSFCKPGEPAASVATLFCKPAPTTASRKQKYPPECPLPLPFRPKIQKMLWRSGRAGSEQGRSGPESPLLGVENSPHHNRNARSVSCCPSAFGPDTILQVARD